MPPRRLRALVVEDDPGQRFLVSTVLKHNGFEVTTADDGIHALEVIAADPPDLIVLDLNLPTVDGRDVLADVRRSSPSTPVVVVSGAPDAREHAQTFGADAVVPKPFEVSDLLATVEAVTTADQEDNAGVTNGYGHRAC